jgi:xylose isomerase
MGKFKYAACLWALGGAADRFCPGGYTDKSATLKELIEIVGDVDGMEGVEIFDSHLEGINPKDYMGWLTDNGLKTSCITINTFGIKKWKLGSITHSDDKLRREAIDSCKKAVDRALEIDKPLVSLWLGSDGFDYSFQVDYIKQWELLQESVKEIAGHSKDIKICLEYKLKEPRKYLIVPTVMKGLYLAEKCGDNVGVTIDFGHALMGKEKPGESAALLGNSGKLFNVHLNDAYGDWDDDLVAGTVHIPETLEFMYYVDRSGYDGYIGFDIFPFRMDGKIAAELCIKNMRGIERILERIDDNKLKKAMESLDAGNSQYVVLDAVYGV